MVAGGLRSQDDAADASEVGRLAAEVAALQGEREMRAKLEKLLEVQTVQVDLQKELRMKTESLLKVEQETTMKLRQQADQLMRSSGQHSLETDPGSASAAETARPRELEDALSAAKQRIMALEQQLNEARDPETTGHDTTEMNLRKQLEEQEVITKNLRQQMEEVVSGSSQKPPEGELVKLQLLLQSRDKHLDELSKHQQKAEKEASEARYDVDVLRHQVGVLRSEVEERNTEIERSLNCERSLRAEIFSLKDQIERQNSEQQEERGRTAQYSERAAMFEDAQRRAEEIESKLAEDQKTSKSMYNQLASESEQIVASKEQTIKHQTTAIEALNRELKEKQAEIDKLMHLVGSEEGLVTPYKADPRIASEGGGLLPPAAKPADDIQVQRSLESLHKQLKSKDAKIAKQSERLQALTELLETRDGQLQELSTARRDREQMRQRLADMEDAMKSQPRVVSHAEAERRLIQQETRLVEQERQVKDLDETCNRERSEKESLSRELSALRSRLAQGASSSGALEVENERLSKELSEMRSKVEANKAEILQLREIASQSAAASAKASERQMPEPADIASLPSVQRRLQKLEEIDKVLGRDVLVYLQERENKIEGLNSTIALLRKSVDELQTRQSLPAREAGPSGMGIEAATSPAGRIGVEMGTSPVRGSTPIGVGVATDAPPQGTSVAVGRDTPINAASAASHVLPPEVIATTAQALAQHLAAIPGGQATPPEIVESGAQALAEYIAPERATPDLLSAAAHVLVHHARDLQISTADAHQIVSRALIAHGGRSLGATPSGSPPMHGATPTPASHAVLLAQQAEQAARAEASQWKAEQESAAAELREMKKQVAAAQQQIATLTTQLQAAEANAAQNAHASTAFAPSIPSASRGMQGSRPSSGSQQLRGMQPPQSPRGALPPLRRPPSREEQANWLGVNSSPLGLDATQQPGLYPSVPQGGVAANAAAVSGATQMPLVVHGVLTTEDLRTMSLDQIRQELMTRRGETQQLEAQLDEKKQLVMKLIEETNLCNAEVASLKQTLQQAFKGARKQEQKYEELAERQAEIEDVNQNLQRLLNEEKEKHSKLFQEHQQEYGGNETVDQVDQEVGWKLKILAPRQHEVRNSIFLVINRQGMEEVDKTLIAHSLAQQFAIHFSRIEVVEDTRLPDTNFGSSQVLDTTGGIGDVAPGEAGDDDDDAQQGRDLVLVNIADSEFNKAGEVTKSNISALDVLEQVRSDLLRGQRLGALDGLNMDAVFINHGDIILPFAWPAHHARLLLREGRVLAGKHAVVTIHEVRDPYVLRVVAFDTEVGHEFVLHLFARDVALLLDTRDSETFAQEGIMDSYVHLGGPLVSNFRANFTVSEPGLLDVLVGSLSFSVFQNQQILVASEMRIPMPVRAPSGQSPLEQLDGSAQQDADAGGLQLAPVSATMEITQVKSSRTLPPLGAGATRGLRPPQRQCKCLFEEALCFEGRTMVFSLLHTTSADLEEDLLRAIVYYPKTSAQVEVDIWQPMQSDRLRIVSEAGELDRTDGFSVAMVVEELVYPPAFVVRLTSITLKDANKISPHEDIKPHNYIIRVSKDGNSATQIPDMSFALSPSTMRMKLLRCIGLSTPMHGPRETMMTMGAVADAAVAKVGKIITGHVNDPGGLKIKLVGAGEAGANTTMPGAECPPMSALAAGQPAAVRAQLRAKFGKGKQLTRRGIRLQLRGGQDGESIWAVVTVYERLEPYQHFVVHAYEPQTSREWEILADSIDVFKLFTAKADSAVDLNNPAARLEVADVLLHAAELQHQDNEMLLTISSTAARDFMAAKQCQQKAAALRDRENRAPEVAGGEATPVEMQGLAPPTETLEVQAASTHVRTKAVVGFSGGLDREAQMLVEQRGRDRLFVSQKTLPKDGVESEELYRIQIFDAPLTSMLHSYIVLATPLNASALAVAGLPVASPANPQMPGVEGTSEEQTRSYMLKLDDKVLEETLWGTGMMEPSRQEELLNFINQSLCLDKDRTDQLRLCLRKRRPKTTEFVAGAQTKAAIDTADHGSKAATSIEQGIYSREIGGCYPLVRLKRSKDQRNQREKKGADKLKGPSLVDQAAEDRKFLARDWQKLHRVEQPWGGSTVVITVSKRESTYKLGVYDPKSSSNYEMYLATSTCSTPMNILIERVELSNKLDLVLCMYEISFPHQITFVVEHIHTQQEFRLNVGDDEVYTMIENSRKDAFNLFMDQLIHCGAIAGGAEEAQATATVFEETFAGNQVFTRTTFDDEGASLFDGDLRPVALEPESQKKQHVPVVRAQLDYMGGGDKRGAYPEKSVSGGLTMALLYHAEHSFPKDGESLMLRVHKKVSSGDVAFTLRTRHFDGLLHAPDEPQNSLTRAPKQGVDTGNNGRPFEMPPLGAAESGQEKEVTIWLQDKCTYAPCGAYCELVEVPGFSKPVAIFVTDEDSPRVVRVAVTLAQLPFTVLFQAVILENSEGSARVEISSELKGTAGRKVMKSFFDRQFMGGASSGVLQKLQKDAEELRQGELRNKLDELDPETEGHVPMGIDLGEGAGGPLGISKSPPDAPDGGLDVNILYMCTRRKIGRMMVFTIYRDLIAHHMYLRVVMHDPITQRDCHLTLLHYTTQKLLSVLRINRDMLEESNTYHDETEKQERQKLRTELGKLIVSHLYLRRRTDEEEDEEEVLDDLDLHETENVDYQLKMHEIMDSSHTAVFSSKRALLDEARTAGIGEDEFQGLEEEEADGARAKAHLGTAASRPRTLLEIDEEHLLFKGEQDVGGTNVLVCLYNETTKEDILRYSHNLRVVVASQQTLTILAMQDFHEETIDLVLARRNKRHLMSACREHEMAEELYDCLVLQRKGTHVTGVNFQGQDS